MHTAAAVTAQQPHYQPEVPRSSDGACKTTAGSSSISAIAAFTLSTDRGLDSSSDSDSEVVTSPERSTVHFAAAAAAAAATTLPPIAVRDCEAEADVMQWLPPGVSDMGLCDEQTTAAAGASSDGISNCDAVTQTRSRAIGAGAAAAVATSASLSTSMTTAPRVTASQMSAAARNKRGHAVAQSGSSCDDKQIEKVARTRVGRTTAVPARLRDD
jgi:hypothetical protein